MPFSYRIANPDKIVFTRLGTGCLRILFVLVGMIFVAVGMLYYTMANQDDEARLIISLIFSLMGLMAILAGFLLPQQQKKRVPDSIIFDNAKGRAEVTQEASEVKKGYIYYDEIEGFGIRAKSSSSSNSRTNYTYHVQLLKKDGGTWELLRLNNEPAAIREMEKLKSQINLSATPVKEETKLFSSKKYSILSGYTKTEISWRNDGGLDGLFFLALFSLISGSILYVIFGPLLSFEEEIHLLALLVPAIMTAGFIFVISYHVRRILKNMKTEYAVVISNGQFKYIERAPAGRELKTVQHPLSEIHSFSYSFNSEDTLPKLYILTHEQFEQQKNLMRTASINSIKELFSFYKNVVAVDMQNLTPVEMLQVENWLQQQVINKAGVTVA